MYGDIKSNAKINMKGNMTKGFLLMTANGLIFFLLAIYTFSRIYLCFVDTSLFLSLNLFANPASKTIIICAAYLIGFVLLLFMVSEKYKTEAWFCSLSEGSPYNYKVSVKLSFKILYAYLVLNTLKLLCMSLFLAPGIFFSGVIYIILKRGAIRAVFFILCIADAVMLLSGLVFGFGFIQRYANTMRFLCKNPSLSVLNAVKKSTESMDSLCFRCLIVKLRLAYCNILSLLIVPAAYLLPYKRAVLCQFISDMYQGKQTIASSPA